MWEYINEFLFSVGLISLFGGIFSNRLLKEELKDQNKSEKLTIKQYMIIKITLISIGIILLAIVFVWSFI
jgi:heme/copper-type cytochrome/quinol oxidase subunit 2